MSNREMREKVKEEMQKRVKKELTLSRKKKKTQPEKGHTVCKIQEEF